MSGARTSRPLWVDVIRAKGLTPMERIFILDVHDYQGKNGSAFAKEETYAADIGVSERHVRRLIISTQEKGWLTANRDGKRLRLSVAVPDGNRTCGSGTDKGESGHAGPVSATETGHPGPVKPDTQVRSKRTPGSGSIIKEGTHPLNTPTEHSSSQLQALRLTRLLIDLVVERKPDFKKPDIQRSAIDIDRMIRLDNRKPDTIEAVIRWCQADSFWQNNILSTKKLRKQFDQLELKMGNGKAQHGRARNRDFAGQHSAVGTTIAV